jgi:hypothetical protein
MASPVVVISSELQLASLKRWFNRARSMREAFFDHPTGALSDLPTDNLIEHYKFALADRGVDQIAQTTYDLLGDRQPATLKVVEGLAPIALVVVPQDHEASRASSGTLA